MKTTLLKRSRLHSAVLLVLAAVLAATAGCGGAPSRSPAAATPETDIALLTRLGDLAFQRAQTEFPATAPALHQVDLAPGDGRYTFRFADLPGDRVITVTGNVDAVAPSDFSVTAAADPLASLANPPTVPLALTRLRVGPDSVVAAAVQALGAATPRTLRLTMQDSRPVWQAVVNGPKGIVSGTVADETGRFVPDGSTP